MTESDEKMINRCQQGDLSAFDEIVYRYKIPLFNFIYRFLNDYETAEELTQEVFIKIYKNISKFKPEISSFRTWMYKIASNLCKNELRDRVRRPVTENRINSIDVDDQIEQIQDNTSNLDTQLEQKELQEILNLAISSLPEKYRIVIILRDIENMPYEEIAKIIGKPDGTVKSRLNRARLMLKDKMKAYIS